MTADAERDPRTTRWKYLFAPILVVIVLALYPQISDRLATDGEHHGAYFVSNFDE